MDELKPCPFCASEAKLLHEYDEDGDEYHYVQCQTCGVQTDGYFSFPNEPYGWEKAEEVWNRRA